MGIMYTLVALPWLLLWCDHISPHNYYSNSLDASSCTTVSIQLIHKLVLVVTTRNLAEMTPFPGAVMPAKLHMSTSAHACMHT